MSDVDKPHPHPAAPAELKQKFLKKAEQSISTRHNVYKEFWESPGLFWQPKVRQLTEAEMESVMVRGVTTISLACHPYGFFKSGGASSY